MKIKKGTKIFGVSNGNGIPCCLELTLEKVREHLDINFTEIVELEVNNIYITKFILEEK